MFCANIYGPLDGAGWLLKVFPQRNSVAEFVRLKWNFMQKTQKNRFWATLFGLRSNIHTPAMACWKACGRLSIHHNWTFFASWDAISGNLSDFGIFRRGWVTLKANFRWKVASPTNHCWWQKSRVIALSCGIKTSPVHCLVLSQSMHVTDRQTDGRTDRHTDRQNYDS